MAVGLEVGPNGVVDRTYVIAEDAPTSYSVAALRSLKGWKYCQLPESQTALRVTHACVYSAFDELELARLERICEQHTPDEYGHLK